MIEIVGIQRSLQRILWKEDFNEPVRLYQLNTVIYGMASSPFLAMRTLKPISIDEGKSFLLAASVLCDDFYMDDVLSGENSLEVAKTLQHQLIDILQTAHMSLHKWCGNTSELIPNTEKEIFGSSDRQGKNLHAATVILQIDWSERLPEKEASEWKEFMRSLVALNGIKIERSIVIPNAEVIELHGFCDASEKAYGAAIYVRSINPDGKIKVRLVASKSRASTIKQVTIPRLELCSAVLISKLMH
ncbi:integrase catalytic domain-containing protein [Trichonephila clavipes]|nr:integrase catalytic domain-containing protein [Trichonephila clavipes]